MKKIKIVSLLIFMWVLTLDANAAFTRAAEFESNQWNWKHKGGYGDVEIFSAIEPTVDRIHYRIFNYRDENVCSVLKVANPSENVVIKFTGREIPAGESRYIGNVLFHDPTIPVQIKFFWEVKGETSCPTDCDLEGDVCTSTNTINETPG